MEGECIDDFYTSVAKAESAAVGPGPTFQKKNKRRRYIYVTGEENSG